MYLEQIINNLPLIIAGFLTVFLGIAIYNTFKGRKTIRQKFLKALENENLRKINEDIVFEGTITTANRVRAPYSNTQVAASAWSIDVLEGSGKHSSWESEKGGVEGSAIEVSTRNGHKYKIQLDDHTFFFVTPSEFATVKDISVHSNIGEIFSSKTKPTEEQISKINNFAQSKGVELKSSFGLDNLIPGQKKLKISEWNLLSGTTYTIMGVLKPGNLIVATPTTPLQIFEKGIAELFKDGPPDIY
jgi:hypothetical protein